MIFNIAADYHLIAPGSGLAVPAKSRINMGFWSTRIMLAHFVSVLAVDWCPNVLLVQMCLFQPRQRLLSCRFRPPDESQRLVNDGKTYSVDAFHSQIL